MQGVLSPSSRPSNSLASRTGSAPSARCGSGPDRRSAKRYTLLSEWRRKLQCGAVDFRNERAGPGDRARRAAARCRTSPSHMLPTRMARLALSRASVRGVPAVMCWLGRASVTWAGLSGETILVQDGREPSRARFLVPLLGTKSVSGACASRQAILASPNFMRSGRKARRQQGFLVSSSEPVDEKDAVLQLDLAWLPETEEPAVGRFVAFMRDAVRSRRLA